MFKRANPAVSLYRPVRPSSFVTSRNRPWERCICHYRYNNRNKKWLFRRTHRIALPGYFL